MPFDKLPSETLEMERKIEMRSVVLNFEDLMVEELIDWIHVSSHDMIEIAP